ncbi:hypothetical protein FUAX_35150 [Fulvitalea axinellae]|uniref:Peptidase n=1 Tax=Fulvitalea axinellae TaxID=1182444 RepID=A0AAU9CLK7_9BACT|nr:hypothetical protein FUAX_35150 [Fulvitalea axinellae]
MSQSLIFLGLFAMAMWGIWFYFYGKTKRKKQKATSKPFPETWRKFLLNKVLFYKNLPENQRPNFEKRIQEFLALTKVTGVETAINDEDRLLVASSAIIPVFGFPDWTYPGLKEVLLYPGPLSSYQTEDGAGAVQGMVGNGPIEGKVLLSKVALHTGFDNEEDKANVGIHEFVHLIDKADGQIDGIPEALMDKKFALPWLDLAHKKMAEINDNESDINPYGATDKVEFLTVASEYFFERPKLLKKKHPELYRNMERIFMQNMADTRDLSEDKVIKPGRNSPCPCGSGKKYKRCCGA